ncbi:MAG TPA: DUF3710 domain-containing protein [Actinophytocola sp.]|uniref:DUF3710 domain-containing protein n=1 Tax=Actinophytocola sp. TaxID=1872138 RepID=UPI002DDD681F|nr:DUF3710 domain-containing protein [Actinophytocola sp.]HEV2779120.1 DUF3710 domain-containing protein [Actinophytocola sp.]
MGLFGRRGRRGAEEPELAEDDFQDGHVEGSLLDELGPYDEADAPDDGVARLDLGSLRLPVPDGAQLQVEMDPAGPVKAVHVLTQHGQFTVNAYAAPKSGGLWEEVCGELAEQLRGDGATVRSEVGDWGQELAVTLGQVALRFVGVDGPRWMLRGVVAGPPDRARPSATALRDLLRGTVVVRGALPMPVRTPLPIDLPEAIAEHIAQAQADPPLRD